MQRCGQERVLLMKLCFKSMRIGFLIKKKIEAMIPKKRRTKTQSIDYQLLRCLIWTVPKFFKKNLVSNVNHFMRKLLSKVILDHVKSPNQKTHESESALYWALYWSKITFESSFPQSGI